MVNLSFKFVNNLLVEREKRKVLFFSTSAFISNFSSIVNNLIFFSAIFSFCFGMASSVFLFTNTGTSNFFQNKWC